MKLLPIAATIEENERFAGHSDCEPGLSMTVDFFGRIGYMPSWIGYFAQVDGELVENAAFKGKPKEGTVEIAYGTFPAYQQQGIGTQICGQLVRLALQTDPTVRITARTIDADNYSTRILQKNDFVCLGQVWDNEDGNVWEWAYQPAIR